MPNGDTGKLVHGLLGWDKMMPESMAQYQAGSPTFRVASKRGGLHTYLRIAPGERHPVVQGFDETAILPFGGTLERLRIDPGATVPLTFIPAFPVNPPETSWMREPATDIPGMVMNTRGAARIAYLPADLDRRYGRGNLLANIFRWAAAGRIPLEVKGPGLIDCHLYRQPGRLILHLVNLTNEGTWRAPLDETIPVGPIRVRVKLADDVRGRAALYLVSGAKPAVAVRQGWAVFGVNSLAEHEVVVIL